MKKKKTGKDITENNEKNEIDCKNKREKEKIHIEKMCK